MKPSELFDLWAPPAAVWSRWAKPVLFAQLDAVPPVSVEAEPLPHLAVRVDSNSAVIVDLPGALSVRAGLAFLEMGFRPVPLFNGNRGPAITSVMASALVDNEPVIAWLVGGASRVEHSLLPFDAPPVFLLDSRRKAPVSFTPGRFDNRWIVFPQDFPSAAFLRRQGITRAVLIQENALSQPQEDLAHVLRRWQEAGLRLFMAAPMTEGEPQPLEVERPSRFRALCYTVLAMAGMRRNSAGGFGSIIPQPSSGG